MLRRSLPLAALAASALALVGCASATASGSESGRITVVAATDVYGQIAEQIGGDAVEVTALIAGGGADPHSFEPSAQDQLAVRRADLIIENGGGYDPFVDALIDSSGSDAAVITAVEYAEDFPDADEHSADEEHDHEHLEGFNEHVWYDPHAIEHVAEAVVEELSTLSPDDAETFAANGDAFTDDIAALEAGLDEIAAGHSGEKVFVTEPVPLRLIAAARLENVTPEAFTEAVEEGQDVPPTTLLEATRLLGSDEVAVLIANAQTGGAESTAVIDEARTRGIPVLEFTETLPEGETYVSWMQSNVAALAGALER